MNSSIPVDINTLYTIFSYYKDVDYDNDYYIELGKELSEYQSFIKNKIDERLGWDIYYEVRTNCQKILDSIESYYNGKVGDAILDISNIINSKYLINDRYLKSQLQRSIAGISINDFIKKNYDANNCHRRERHFFKARTLESPYSYLAQDKMFHIPFNKRELIANQRYSINGLPCLYLGSTALVCWEELDRPNFENFYVSYFAVSDSASVTILDLSYGYFEIDAILNCIISNQEMCFKSDEALLKEMLIIWPLVAASRYTVKSKNRTFKSEYIIPQLIMQSILKLNINGVSYISTRIPRNIIDEYKERFEPKILYTNYAFPAIKDEDDSYFSKTLRSLFKMSDVFNLGSFRHLNSQQKHSRIHIKYDDFFSPMNLFGIQKYHNSIFNEFEDKLCDMRKSNIEDSYSNP